MQDAANGSAASPASSSAASTRWWSRASTREPKPEPPALDALKGKIAIANAKLAYERYKRVFSGPRWEALAKRGARTQRVLWASTSTKNPKYRDVMYIEQLIGPDTVNTVPPATLDAFLEHGEIAQTLEANVDQARQQMAALKPAEFR